MTLEDALSVVDKEGIALVDALRRTLDAQPGLPRRRSGFPVAAYLEAHIEQGPVLEAAGVTLGAVTGVQGSRWFAVEVRGEEAHAGTTPRSSRRDAMVAAVRIVNALYDATTDADDLLRFTVGRFEVEPGSPNTVPGRVFFTIDLRHPEEKVLETVTARIHEACERHRGPCLVHITMTSRVSPVRFDPELVEMVVGSAGRLGLSCRRMQSGAGHDAMLMAGLCPTAMIFVPCERGISHNEAEQAKPDDLAAGARVLAGCLVRLAGC
jgi:N-carbamoyl-L-amino-acid hydrolase